MYDGDYLLVLPKLTIFIRNGKNNTLSRAALHKRILIFSV